ncbi:ribose-5-phosphate isomerase RpiA [Francisella adeliensis]|uniref:Ribose-5-phosphate isomerase A n=1 Tax=Francisella adeliensis TaxID=2007306 RepID=A0A2Z4XYK0_9GAMM|nr:ribose-5-phosphate isomerase RpiA [Francisella adeliensis]AXA33830.1 ribose 5-phosphate isomerase A [Francisella adeliensis]MBK2085731.1 ribose-5-phosphate isomerase RpiA [Francisella adeliensis]MBK2097609.1 ribose-5-phosphate isomerase RpiA [Francisella adeliensis]QIW12067.1 ribose-5-phosphate isomerase RpiA [Francisella adeliensis]QIW13941.1 ribose-5-phosphate isomerase RpiA [Francisella adeliensis]
MIFKKKDNQNELKKLAAIEAAKQITSEITLGVGTGSTVAFLIEELVNYKDKIKQVVSSSEDSTKKLKALGFDVVDLNYAGEIDLYIDGADECNKHKELIKGGGAALTREKICVAAAKKFVCIIDESKLVNILGTFPLPVEVIPMARSFVAREIIKLGGQPVYREGTITDNGNVILDVFNMKIDNPLKLETELNQITGVVTNGLFALKPANVVIMAKKDGEIESF